MRTNLTPLKDEREILSYASAEAESILSSPHGARISICVEEGRLACPFVTIQESRHEIDCTMSTDAAPQFLLGPSEIYVRATSREWGAIIVALRVAQQIPDLQERVITQRAISAKECNRAINAEKMLVECWDAMKSKAHLRLPDETRKQIEALVARRDTDLEYEYEYE